MLVQLLLSRPVPPQPALCFCCYVAELSDPRQIPARAGVREATTSDRPQENQLHFTPSWALPCRNPACPPEKRHGFAWDDTLDGFAGQAPFQWERRGEPSD